MSYEENWQLEKEERAREGERERERDGPRVEKGQRSTIKREGGIRESNARMAEEEGEWRGG